MEDLEKTALAKQMEAEISDYLTKTVNLGDNINYSQHKLVRRITLFESKTYPTGKFDKQGNYKGWYEVTSPRIEAEIKNIDFDTKNIEAYTPRPIDETANLITNLKVREWLRDNGQAEELNSAIEEGAGWGNVVWKKVKGGYERVDLKNFYVINQTAKTLNETPAIERHQMSQTDLRGMDQSKFQYVKEVIEKCGKNAYKSDANVVEQDTTTPYYMIFERNGEVCVKDLKIYRGEPVLDGDESRYTLAKVIAAGVEGAGSGVKIKYVMYAQEMAKSPYKEYHRSRYRGRWFCEGLYEILFDIQVRSNEIGNQIARGLEWASKTIFTDEDKLIVQNIMTDMKNGDVIRSKDLRQVEVRMQGLDQLIAEWNRLMSLANELANSREIVQGDSLPSGTPFRLGLLQNVNANKLFDFIREKLSIPIREIFEEWIIPSLIKDLKAEEVLRLTGDSDMLRRMQDMIVENWYVNNLIAIGPHTKEEADALKQAKRDELKKRTLFIKEFAAALEDYRPRVSVIITGENIDLQSKLQTLGTFIQLETDPVRRSFLIEKAMRMAGVDTGDLPRSTPDQLAGVKPQTAAAPENPANLGAPNDLAQPVTA
jgi:hypothetical protein